MTLPQPTVFLALIEEARRRLPMLPAAVRRRRMKAVA
jgi:hypothetical protein